MSDHQTKICFLADSHSLYDDRIYWKQACSLKKAGYTVYYLLAGDSSKHGTTKEGIHYQVFTRDRYPGKPLLNYIVKRARGGLYKKMYRAAAQLKAQVYHIHDLKINRFGKKLRELPHHPKLVYDVHEPYPENVLDYWSHRKGISCFRGIWARRTKAWERKKTKEYDLIITTEENMQKRFAGYFPGKAVEVIYNYTNVPMAHPEYSESEKVYDAIYTGGITEYRGAMKILQAAVLAKNDLPALRILFLGTWFPKELRTKMEEYIDKHKLNKHVVLKDAVPYSEVSKYYSLSRIGMGIFLPITTHRIILQIKIFEYLNFGLPILGSNFGHIHRIIETHGCGVSVDPEDPQSIANGLVELLNNAADYERKRNNGLKAAQKFYRWEMMEKKLLDLYRQTLDVHE